MNIYTVEKEDEMKGGWMYGPVRELNIILQQLVENTLSYNPSSSYRLIKPGVQGAWEGEKTFQCRTDIASLLSIDA